VVFLWFPCLPEAPLLFLGQFSWHGSGLLYRGRRVPLLLVLKVLGWVQDIWGVLVHRPDLIVHLAHSWVLEVYVQRSQRRMIRVLNLDLLLNGLSVRAVNQVCIGFGRDRDLKFIDFIIKLREMIQILRKCLCFNMRINFVIFRGWHTLLLKLDALYPTINEAVTFCLHGHRRFTLLPWILLLLSYIVNDYDISMRFIILIAVLILASITVIFIDFDVFLLVLFLVFITWLFVIILPSVDRACPMRDDWNLDIQKSLA